VDQGSVSNNGRRGDGSNFRNQNLDSLGGHEGGSIVRHGWGTPGAASRKELAAKPRVGGGGQAKRQKLGREPKGNAKAGGREGSDLREMGS